jgi:pimeloyl-ACP methyl ester carboxylesterase
VPNVAAVRDETWITTRDGRRLFAEHVGVGPARRSASIVFESGLGMSRSMWGAVVATASQDAGCVVYDRAGLGRSEPDPSPRLLNRLADDLEDVLGALGSGPYVLVGHSWGGPLVRVVAGRQPELVAGLVLVDATDEGCELFFTTASDRQAAIGARVLPWLARVGVLRLAARRAARQLPEPWATASRAEDGTRAAAQAQVAELTGWLDDLRALRDEPLPTPTMPLTVISGTRPAGTGRARRRALVAAHRQRAAAAPQGRFVEATASGHLVPLTEPQLVAAEALRLATARPTSMVRSLGAPRSTPETS